MSHHVGELRSTHKVHESPRHASCHICSWPCSKELHNGEGSSVEEHQSMDNSLDWNGTHGLNTLKTYPLTIASLYPILEISFRILLDVRITACNGTMYINKPVFFFTH